MNKSLITPIAKLIARQVFLDFHLLLNDREISLRACMGNPGACQVLALDRRFRYNPTVSNYVDLHLAIAEYRRALLN